VSEKKKGGFGAMLHGLGQIGELSGQKAAAPSPAPANVENTGAESPAIAELRIPLDMIDADPNQPRRHFDADALDELANSLKANGQIQAISVRPNPERPGRYLINVGERRWRAAQLAGWTDLRAEIGEQKDLRVAQLVENIQREGLTDGEVADALAAYLAETGMKAGALAKKIGKSDAFVSAHMQLRHMPATFREALEAHTVMNIFVLNEAFRLYKDHPDKVTEMIVGAGPDAPVTAVAVRKLKASLSSEDARPKGGKAKTTPEAQETPATNPPAATADHHASVYVCDDEGKELGRLMLERTDAEDGVALIESAPAGPVIECPFAEVRICRIVQQMP
jgi:ParB family transcriptional regulator, chromosome partitioning protein